MHICRISAKCLPNNNLWMVKFKVIFLLIYLFTSVLFGLFMIIICQFKEKIERKGQGIWPLFTVARMNKQMCF